MSLEKRELKYGRAATAAKVADEEGYEFHHDMSMREAGWVVKGADLG